MSKLTNIVASSAVLPFLYLFGYAYDQGYLVAYGLNNEFFARSVQDYLILSFHALSAVVMLVLGFMVEDWIYIVIFGFIVLMVCLVGAFLSKIDVPGKTEGLVGKVKKNPVFLYLGVPLLVAVSSVTFPFLLVVVISIFMLIPPGAYFIGKDAAEKEILNAAPCAYPDTSGGKCFSLLEDGKLIASGVFVARSSTHVAFFDQGKTTVYPVKDQIVEVMPKNILKRK